MIETDRLVIRPMIHADGLSFIRGISDRSLRLAYGFPAEMDEKVPPEIFRRFRKMERSYSVLEKKQQTMIGFLLDVDPELPEEAAHGLPANGRTLAYSVFPAFQRKGYMTEVLRIYLPRLFREMGAGYVHCGRFTDNTACGNLLSKLGFREYARHTVGGRTVIDEIAFPAGFLLYCPPG